MFLEALNVKLILKRPCDVPESWLLMMSVEEHKSIINSS